MSQALSNLAIGSKVKFGKHSINGEVPEPIIWTIVDKNHTGYPSNSVTLNTTQIIDVRSFDSHEPNNPNSNRATHGNNNYQVSNLDQWLNKSDADGKWYQAAHAYDYPPLTVPSSGESSYVERPGFLHFFTSQERASLLNTTLKVLMPRIDTNAGTIQTISRKVFLFSLPEVGLGTENGVSDGTAIAYFTSATRVKTVTDQVFDNTKAIGAHLPSSRNAPHYWWLRTPYYADTFTVTGVFNTTTGTRGDYTAQTANIGVAPAINLSSSLKVTTTVDKDGCYTFVWPSKPGLWIGGTEKYTSNEIRNVFIALDSLRKVSWRDDLDEFISATSGNMIQGWIDNNDDAAKCSWWCATGKATSASGVVGSRETMSFTFARALTGVSFAFMNYRYDNSVEAENEEGSLEIYLNNETTPKTSVHYTKADTYINYDLGNVSAGDTIKIRMWTAVGDDSIPNFTIRVLPSCDSIALTPEIVSVPGTRTNDRRVSSVYAGVVATVPKYTETTTIENIALSSSTFTDFFNASNTGTSGSATTGVSWSDNSGGLKLVFGNYNTTPPSVSKTTFIAQRNLTNIVIKGLYFTYSADNRITLTVGSTVVLDGVNGSSGTESEQLWTGSLNAGQSIVLSYTKQTIVPSADASLEAMTHFIITCDSYQKTVTTQTQTGTETKLVDKRIVAGYIGGPNGKAKLFYESVPLTYTGEYTEQDYTDANNVKHKIYALTTSGKLTITKKAEFWMCGGGTSGQSGYYRQNTNNAARYSGLGGSSGFISSYTLSPNIWDITIGVGGAEQTSYISTINVGGFTNIESGTITYIANAGTASGGGSGGGSGCIRRLKGSSISARAASTGAGISTIPFGLDTLFDPIAAGGGGGGITYSGKYYSGGKGGSNGSAGASGHTGYYAGGASGEKGGGKGGDGTHGSVDGSSAISFGSGGGGGGCFYNSNGTKYGTGGAGYQGVVYIAIPPITTT